MSVINQAVAAVNAGVLDDNRTATAAGTQAYAAAITASYTRFTVASNASTNVADAPAAMLKLPFKVPCSLSPAAQNTTTGFGDSLTTYRTTPVAGAGCNIAAFYSMVHAAERGILPGRRDLPG